ncbi:OLC1v1000978C1 [Oldenlandia corymbosa var. corymbosa]|uniref:OLC1v1000978C1 n=1 Tax=Oldenlandia corymbosa var. corymbosa TaxID=529605 RepID=A0AAV1D5C0_OLDCO|nr:OLC1v1000978C1 [Oldenlandia corymbosa var. corymbosa]
MQLQSWRDSNRDVIEDIIADYINEKPRRILESPTDSQIQTISQVKNLTQQSSMELKSFRLKARAKIAKLDQRLYAFSCPGCSKTCGLSEPSEFTCLYCNTNYPNPNSVSDSEKESVASDTASKMSIDTPSPEDEATTSKQVEARTIPAKRMLQSTDNPSYAKHIKQD